MDNVVNLLNLDDQEALRILTEPIAAAGQSTAMQQQIGAGAGGLPPAAASAPPIALPVDAVVARLRSNPQLLHCVRESYVSYLCIL